VLHTLLANSCTSVAAVRTTRRSCPGADGGAEARKAVAAPHFERVRVKGGLRPFPSPPASPLCWQQRASQAVGRRLGDELSPRENRGLPSIGEATAMELRLLCGEDERRVFESRMTEARAKHGVGFKEVPRLKLGEIHLRFGELYGLFEEENQPADRMMSGFALHDLESLPQSYPQPDLGRYPAWSVLECGELWSFSKGAGVLARRG